MVFCLHPRHHVAPTRKSDDKEQTCINHKFANHDLPPIIGPARAIDAVALHSDLRQLDVPEFNVSGWVLEGMCLRPMICFSYVFLVGF